MSRASGKAHHTAQTFLNERQRAAIDATGCVPCPAIGDHLARIKTIWRMT